MCIVKFKELTVNLSKEECYSGSTKVNLTKTEFNLLAFLINNIDKAFTRRDLLKSVWTNEASLRAIDLAISRLRRKLKDSSRYIKTKANYDYSFQST